MQRKDKEELTAEELANLQVSEKKLEEAKTQWGEYNNYGVDNTNDQVLQQARVALQKHYNAFQQEDTDYEDPQDNSKAMKVDAVLNLLQQNTDDAQKQYDQAQQALRKTTIEWQQDEAELKRQRLNLKDSIRTAQEQLVQAQAAKKQMLSICRQEIHDLQLEKLDLARKSTQVVSLQDNLESIEGQLQNAWVAVKNLHESQKRQKQRIQVRLGQKNALNERFERLEDEITSLKLESSETSDQDVLLKSYSEDEDSDLGVESEKSSLSTLEAEKRKLEKQLQAMREELQSAEKKSTAIEDELKKASDNVARLSNEQTGLQGELTQLYNAIGITVDAQDNNDSINRKCVTKVDEKDQEINAKVTVGATQRQQYDGVIKAHKQDIDNDQKSLQGKESELAIIAEGSQEVKNARKVLSVSAQQLFTARNKEADFLSRVATAFKKEARTEIIAVDDAISEHKRKQAEDALKQQTNAHGNQDKKGTLILEVLNKKIAEFKVAKDDLLQARIQSGDSEWIQGNPDDNALHRAFIALQACARTVNVEGARKALESMDACFKAGDAFGDLTNRHNRAMKDAYCACRDILKFLKESKLEEFFGNGAKYVEYDKSDSAKNARLQDAQHLNVRMENDEIRHYLANDRHSSAALAPVGAMHTPGDKDENKGLLPSLADGTGFITYTGNVTMEASNQQTPPDKVVYIAYVEQTTSALHVDTYDKPEIPSKNKNGQYVKKGKEKEESITKYTDKNNHEVKLYASAIDFVMAQLVGVTKGMKERTIAVDKIPNQECYNALIYVAALYGIKVQSNLTTVYRPEVPKSIFISSSNPMNKVYDYIVEQSAKSDSPQCYKVVPLPDCGEYKAKSDRILAKRKEQDKVQTDQGRPVKDQQNIDQMESFSRYAKKR